MGARVDLEAELAGLFRETHDLVESVPDVPPDHLLGEGAQLTGSGWQGNSVRVLGEGSFIMVGGLNWPHIVSKTELGRLLGIGTIEQIREIGVGNVLHSVLEARLMAKKMGVRGGR